MEIRTRVFLDGKQINPSELSKIVIKNPNVDRIINDIVERSDNRKSKDNAVKAS